MKRILLGLAIVISFSLAVVLTIANAQSITSAPQAIMMVSSNGNAPYAPLTLALGSGLSVNSAPFIIPMCSATGVAPFTPCNFGTSAYNPASVAITGGTIDGTTIGGTTPAAITGTTVTAKPASANLGFTVFGTGGDSALSATLADNGSADFELLSSGNSTLQFGAGGSGNLIMDAGSSGTVFIGQQQSTPVNIGKNGQITTIAAPVKAGGTNSVSGCSLTTAVGGAWAGSFHSGTTGTCTVTITPGITATNGFTCWSNDLTTVADVLHQTSASNATTAVISGTTASGDVINWGCIAY